MTGLGGQDLGGLGRGQGRGQGRGADAARGHATLERQPVESLGLLDGGVDRILQRLDMHCRDHTGPGDIGRERRHAIILALADEMTVDRHGIGTLLEG